MRKLTSREKVLLMLVAVMTIVGLIYGRGGNFVGGGGRAAIPEAKDYGNAPVVEIARLSHEPESYDPNARNLFTYYTPPPKPRPKPKPIERPKAETRKVVPQPTRPVNTTPPKPKEPTPPRPNFKYIGFLGPKENKIAVLEKGDEVVLAQMGEIVDEQFLIAGFEYETLVIGYTSERFKEKTTELPMKR